ncbi:branched-chain amino acid ABC transporter permease [Microvirga sp. M2]|uniref:branched-chain amino acid ABC transporter permease n=1 Tax=Microvirga sp. M2 TaxID=3073270 RepID=UPI0039C3AFE3
MKVVNAMLLVIGLAVMFTIPLWADQGILFIAGLVLVEVVFALSWNLLFGFTGLASFGHAAFFAIGAYLCGYALRAGFEAPFLLLILAAGAAGAVAAVLTGTVLLRRTTGIHLAIFTLALAEVLRILVGYSTALGREDGLASIPRPTLGLGFTSFDLTSGEAYYWFLCIAVAAIAGFLWLIAHGPFGRILVSIRQDAERTAFMGINVPAYRLAAFTISGATSGMAGALYAPWAQIVTPESAHWLHSTQPMLASLLGGAQSFWGPVVGTVLFSIINYSTRNLVGLSELVIGAILLVIVLAAPSGVVGLVRELRRQVSRHGSPVKNGAEGQAESKGKLAQEAA